jgi:dethiobiotin synthetase
MSKQFRPVTLSGLSNGALQEVFERELDNVLNNIQDENTPEKAVRKIVLEIEFKPHDSRDIAEVTLKAQSKLAPVREMKSLVYLEGSGGKISALEKVEDHGAIDFKTARGM